VTAQELLDLHGCPDLAGPLESFLTRQRWFGGQGRAIRSVVIDDAVALKDSEPTMLLLFVRVAYSAGGDETYNVPVGLGPDGPPSGVGPASVIATPSLGEGGPTVYDALADGHCSALLWEAMADGLSRDTCAGVLDFAARGDSVTRPAPDEIRPLFGEQSNTALVWRDEQFLKYIRRLEPGPSIELEMGGALAGAGFLQMATLCGSILYRRPGWPAASPVALLQPFLAAGINGWTLALETLDQLYRVLGTGGHRQAVDPPDANALKSAFAAEAGRLGSVTAAMHLALGSSAMTGPMEPVAISEGMLSQWADEMTEQLEGVLADTEVEPGLLAPLRRARDRLVRAFDDLRTLPGGGLATRVHGDYHLGQVMLSGSEWFVLDFEGEPKRTPVQRRRLYSPLRDVAGMMRSLDYAAAVALAAHVPPSDSRWPGLIAEGESWVGLCRRSLWETYIAATASSGLLAGGTADLQVRRAFEIDKAVYEVRYELAHRPEWAAIPIRFLTAIGEAAADA